MIKDIYFWYDSYTS